MNEASTPASLAYRITILGEEEDHNTESSQYTSGPFPSTKFRFSIQSKTSQPHHHSPQNPIPNTPQSDSRSPSHHLRRPSQPNSISAPHLRSPRISPPLLAESHSACIHSQPATPRPPISNSSQVETETFHDVGGIGTGLRHDVIVPIQVSTHWD